MQERGSPHKTRSRHTARRVFQLGMDGNYLAPGSKT